MGKTSRIRPKRVLLWALLVGMSLLAAGELFARVYLGLGDPPLSIQDPDIEYLFKPGTYHRFGNVVSFNAHSMRSPEVTPYKTDAREFRLLVIGDSVVSGGALTDDADLATTLLKPRLEKQLSRPCFVGNISAGSWGPPNQLAYLRKFGLFDADAAVFVFNSEDGEDVPTFAPVVGTASFPNEKPWLAIGEAVTRYRPGWLRLAERSTTSPGADCHQSRATVRSALVEAVNLFQQRGVPVVFVIWPKRSECQGEFLDAVEPILSVARDKGVPLLDLREPVRQEIARNVDPYRPNDMIHPNETGQRILADSLEQAVIDSLKGNLSR